MPDQENEPEELEEETEPSDVNIFAGVTSGSVHITGVKMAYYHILQRMEFPYISLIITVFTKDLCIQERR